MIDRIRLAALCGAATLLLSLPVASQEQPPAPPAPPAGGDAPPPLPPPAAGLEIFVAVDGRQTGPHNEAALQELVRSGKLNAQTLVWEKGMPAWAAANTVPKLGTLLAAAPPPALPFDCTAYLVGTWERTEMIAGQQMVTQSVLAPGGQFTGVQTAMGLPGSQFYGSWKANAVGPKTCSMTWDMQYPYSTSTTLVFSIVDQYTMTQQGSNAQIRRVQ